MPKVSLSRHKTASRVAFSPSEQALTCLSIISQYQGREISVAEIRNGRSLLKCQYGNLEQLAAEKLISIERCLVGKNDQSFCLPVVSIASIKKIGPVIIEKKDNGSIYINSPLTGWRKYPGSETSITSALMTDYVYSAPKENQALIESRPETKSTIATLLLSDTWIRNLAVLIIGLTVLKGLTKLLDPITKNLFFTIVVQIGDINWARPLAWIYLSVAAVGALLIMFAGTLSILLSSRLGIRWSFTTMANLLRTPTSYLQIRQPGDLLNRVRSSEVVSNFIGVDEVTLVASLLNLCLMILVLAVSSPTLSILLLLFQIIGFGFVLATAAPKKIRTDQHVQVLAEETSSFVHIINELSNFNDQSRTLDAFRLHQTKIIKRVSTQQRLSIFSVEVSFITTIIDTLQSTILLTIAALLIVDGNISLGQYVAFSAIMTNVIAPFKTTASFISKLQSIRTINERVQDINEEARLVSMNPVQRLESSYAITIENTAAPQEGIFRIKQQDTPANITFATKDDISHFESLIAGDDHIPSYLRLGLPYENKKKQLIVARTKPYLYKKSLRANITLWKKAQSAQDYEEFYTISRILGFKDLELDKSLSVSSLLPEELYYLGIARALWCKPKYIVICEPNGDANVSIDSLISRISPYCHDREIGLLYLSTTQSKSDFSSVIQLNTTLLRDSNKS